MAVSLEVEEIAVGDYSDEYGHVIEANSVGDDIRLKFVNGTELTLPKGAELTIDQGGRF